MKTKTKFAWLMTGVAVVLFSLGMTSCKKTGDGDAKPYINVSDTTVVLPQTATTATVTIDANCDWQITPNVSWITIRPSNSGSGKGTIKVIVSANTEISTRVGKLSITTNKNLPAFEVTVKQLGLGATVAANKTDVAFSYAPATQGITVTSNVNWTAEVPEGAWFSVEPLSNNGQERVGVTITVKDYNETLEAKTAQFKIKYEDGGEVKELPINVSQAACEPSIALSAATMSFTSIEAAQQKVTLSAAGTWTASVPNWITLTPASGHSGADQEVTVAVTKNTGTEERAFDLIFKGLGNAADTLKVTQAGNKPVVNCESEFTVDCAAGSADFEITTNYGWTAVVAESWASMSPLSGDAGKTTAKITVEANKGLKRTCKITFTCTDPASHNSVDKIVTLIQSAYDGDDMSAAESANCYIINQGDHAYKFNATVRGNGHSDKGANITVTPIDLSTPNLVVMELWRDNASPVITNLSMNKDKGYIYFTTPQSLVKGNVVIALAIMDEFDNTVINKVLWSWHIWSTPDDLATKAMPITYGVTSKPAVDVTLMDRNLGANSNGSLGTEQDIIDSRGMHYEWGRKDPFPGGSDFVSPWNAWEGETMTYISGTRYPLYRTTADGTKEVTSEFAGIGLEGLVSLVEKPDEMTSIQYAIEHPMTYITGSGSSAVYPDCKNIPSSWIYVPTTLRNGSNIYNEWSWQTYLWGNSNDTELGSTYGTKTIYDPCPAGWRVPDRNTFTFVFTSGGYSSAPEVTVNETVMKHINCSETYNGWLKSSDSPDTRPIAKYNMSESEADYQNFNGGYHIYTGGIQVGETMFFPMAGTFSYDSGNPCSDYTAYGDYASYATNAQDTYKQYVTRLEMDAPSTYITKMWEWKRQYKVNSFPGGNGHPQSSFHQAAGYSVRCMKDVVPAGV